MDHPVIWIRVRENFSENPVVHLDYSICEIRWRISYVLNGLLIFSIEYSRASSLVVLFIRHSTTWRCCWPENNLLNLVAVKTLNEVLIRWALLLFHPFISECKTLYTREVLGSQRGDGENSGVLRCSCCVVGYIRVLFHNDTARTSQHTRIVTMYVF